MEVEKTVKVCVGDPLAALLRSVWDAFDVLVTVEELLCATFVVVDTATVDESGATLNAVWRTELMELLIAALTMLSLSTVPFHNTLHELVLRLVGTESHKRRSFFPSTVKPLGSVAFPCLRIE